MVRCGLLEAESASQIIHPIYPGGLLVEVVMVVVDADTAIS